MQPGGTGGLPENTFLRFKANSIYDIMDSNGNQNQPNSFIAQSTAYQPVWGAGSPTVNAEGWDIWNLRYENFQVIGSKCQATFESISPNVIASGATSPPSKLICPSTFYINLSANNTSITPTSDIAGINQLPFTRRVGLVSRQTTTNASGETNSIAGANGGARVYAHYSASKFEGVKRSALSAAGRLMGHMASNPAHPLEKSYYTIGIMPTIPGSATNPQLPPTGILRVKIEYIVRLTEPTSTNNVQEPAGFFGNLFTQRSDL